jgi:flagellar motor switch protein FliM
MTRSDSQFVRSLLDARARAGGNRPTDPPDAPQAADYDWSVPARFTPAQMRRLNEFAQAAAGEVSAALSGMLNRPVALAAGPPVQEYSAVEDTSAGGAGGYWLALLDPAGTACGSLAFGGPCAVRWVAGLLGGSADDQATEREFSLLEKTLLSDVAAAVAHGISAGLKAAGAEVRAGQAVNTGLPQAPAGGRAEMLRIDFREQDRPDEPAVRAVVACDVMQRLVGRQAAKKANPGDSDASRMLAHLAEAEVVATAWLGESILTTREIVSLEPGDVLLLGTNAADAIDVLVQGREVLCGTPARSGGKYAVRVAATRTGADGKQERNNTNGRSNG